MRGVEYDLGGRLTINRARALIAVESAERLDQNTLSSRHAGFSDLKPLGERAGGKGGGAGTRQRTIAGPVEEPWVHELDESIYHDGRGPSS